MHKLESDEIIKYEDVDFFECQAVKLHYVIYERNIWHAKRGRKYTPGCMNYSFSAAKDKVENDRKCGSTFYISELPALLFIGEEISLVITEINTNMPLASFTSVGDRLNNYLASIVRHFYTYKANSVLKLLLNNNLRSTDDAVTVESETVMDRFDQLGKNTALKAFRSESVGGKWLLHWTQVANTASQTNVLNLAHKFNRLLQ